MITATLGADFAVGDTYEDVTGPHVLDRLTPYPGPTLGDGGRRCHCSDGTCWTLLDHHTYPRNEE